MSLTGGLSASLTCHLSMGLGGGMAAQSAAWNPGQLPGTPREWLAGPDWCYTDGSAAFNGTGTAGLTSGSAATMASSDWSVSAWVKPVSVVPSGGDGVVSLFTNTSGATGNFSVAMLATAVLEVVFWNGAAMRKANASGVFTAGTWKHVVAGVTSGVPWAYVNGSVVSLSTDIGAGTGWGTGFGLGAYYAGTSDPWNGSIAASGLWSRTLTPTEISSLYNGGLGKVYADLTTGEKVGLTSFWDLTRSGVYTDSHGANNLTATVGGGGAITFGAGLPRSRAGDTDPVSVIIDRFQGTLWTQTDPLKRLVLRDLGSGRWVLRSDGINDGIGSGPATTGARTIAAAYTTSAAASSSRMIQGDASSFFSPRRTNSNTIYVNGLTVRGAVFADDTDPHTFVMQRAGGGNWLAWNDGASLVVSDVAAEFGSLGVGATSHPETFTGDIYSVVDVAADISDADRAKLTTYLAALYGGSL